MKKIIFSLLVFSLFSSLVAIPYTVLGNVNTPDGYVLPHLMAEINYTSYFVNDEPAFGDDDIHYAQGAALSVGILNRGELAIIAASEDIYHFNGKVKLITETPKYPSLAIGVDNMFGKYSDTDNNQTIGDLPDRDDYIKNSPYVVLSKSTLILTNLSYLPQLETVFHFGIGTRKFRGKGSTTKHASGFFGGVDFRFSEFIGSHLEFDSRNINIGIDLFFRNFTFRAGMFEVEDYFKIKGDNSGYKFAFNLKYTLDMFSDVKARDKDRTREVNYPIGRSKAVETFKQQEQKTQQQNTSNDPILEELKKISERRKQAEKELEEIKKLLEED